MSDRSPTNPLFRAVLDLHRQRVDDVRLDIAQRTRDAVLRAAADPTAPATPADRKRALAEIDRAFAEHYGVRHGDLRSSFGRIILEDSRAALIAGYDLSILIVEDRLRARRRRRFAVLTDAVNALLRRIRR